MEQKLGENSNKVGTTYWGKIAQGSVQVLPIIIGLETHNYTDPAIDAWNSGLG